MQRNPHSYQIATGYRTFYSLSLIYQPITKKRLFFLKKLFSPYRILFQIRIQCQLLQRQRIQVIMFLPSERSVKEVNIPFVITRSAGYFQIFSRSSRHIYSQRAFIDIVSFFPSAKVIQTESFPHQFHTSLPAYLPQKSRNGRITGRIKIICNVFDRHFRYMSACTKFINGFIGSRLIKLT